MDTDHLQTYLRSSGPVDVAAFRDPTVHGRLLDVDRLAGSLPGFEGSEPMRSFLEGHGLQPG